MPSRESHSVRNGVLATVIGGLVLAALAAIWPAFKQVVIWLWQRIAELAGLFGNSYLIPGWALALLILCGLPTVIRIALSVRKQQLPGYTSYVQDTIKGVTWRWAWNGAAINGLWAFCPRCDSELVYDDSSCNDIISGRRETSFICEHCGHQPVTTITGGNKGYALSAIEREIRRKVRTNELPAAKT
jgi:hypothetical protein